jgi:hypothetical protein
MTMRYLLSLCTGLTTLVFSTACLADSANPVVFSLQELTFTHILCPTKCSNGIKTFLQPHIGEKVQIGPNRFSGALVDKLFDPCDGTIEIKLKQQSRQQQIAELKKMTAPKRKFDSSSLRLPTQPVSALAVCNSKLTDKPGSAANNMARIISIENGRVLVLFEELTVLEFRGNAVPSEH